MTQIIRLGILGVVGWALWPAAFLQAGMPEYIGPLAPVGYAHPHDTRALLDYRLPDWGYRTWDLTADLRAGGEAVDDDKSVDNQISTALVVHHESEAWTGHLELDFSGSYFRSWERYWSRSHFSLAGNLEAEGRKFVWRDIGLLGGVSYREYRAEERLFDELLYRDTESSGLNPVVGVALGRVRNVVPLLRAKRLSERLVALGRAPLQDNQLQWLAGVFATHSGYLAVYDRADRNFWGAILAEVAGKEPLTAYEVLYLREVLSEFLGDRSEGWEIRTRYFNSEFGYAADLVRHARTVDFQYAHNLDLVRYLEVKGSGYSISYGQNHSRDLRLQANFMWILANRFHWLNGLSGQVTDSWHTTAGDDEGVRVRRRLSLNSSLDYFLEDRLKLTPWVRMAWFDSSPEALGRIASRDWGAGFQVTWYFDRVWY